MVSKISSLLDIRPNETRVAALLIGIMLFSAAGYSLGGTGIEALYFARFGTDLLPYLYMGLGFLSLVTTLGITGLLGRVRRERMYVLVPIAAAGIVLVAWGLLFIQNPIVYPALWLGKESLNAIVSMVGWNTANAACDSRQAKRLFPLFSAARILGSVLGGLGTGALADLIGAQNLALVWSLSMLASFFFARLLMKGVSISETPKKKSRVKRRASSFFQEMQKGWRYVRKSELMQWISAASILFSILYFSIALPFTKSAAARYPNENDLAAFLGLFNGLSTAAAFLTSLLLANRLFARFGIMTMILVFPLIYLAGFGALIPFNLFAVIVAFRFIQVLWLSGIADSAWQTMFSAVPPEKRDQVNAFLNGVPSQAGVFIAGAILLIGEQAFTPQQLYLVGLVTAIAATFVLWRASSAYRRALVDTLREGRPTLFDQPLGATTDATAIRLLIEQLRHADPLARRLAAEMLAQTPRADALIPLLQDADLDVRLAAIRGLAGAPSAAPHLAPLLADPDPAARAQALRTLRMYSVSHEQIGNLLYDPSPLVQIEAALTLLNHGPHPEARDLLRHIAVFGNTDERKAALQAMAEWGDREAFAFIANEMNDMGAPPAIRRAAALALAACGRDAIPTLASALADEEPAVREGAALALAQLGADAIPSLLACLEDRSRQDGALTALSRLPVQKYAHDLTAYAA
ncbi:MAG: MFS transporter, partial [Chloroflexota bacterium]